MIQDSESHSVFLAYCTQFSCHKCMHSSTCTHAHAQTTTSRVVTPFKLRARSFGTFRNKNIFRNILPTHVATLPRKKRQQNPFKMKWYRCEQTKQTTKKHWARLIRIRDKLENSWLNFRRPLAQLLASFLLKAKCHFLNTPLWHVRDIVISSICLQVTVGCTNITFLHLSETYRTKKCNALC